MSAPLQEVLPKAGLVYSEKSTLSEILSKPKIMPLKSITLEKLEEMEEQAKKVFADTRPATSQRPATASMNDSTASIPRPSSSAGDRPSSAGGRPASAAGRPSSSAGGPPPGGLNRGGLNASVSQFGMQNYGASGYGPPAAGMGSSTNDKEPSMIRTPGQAAAQEVEEIDDEAPPQGAGGRRNSAPLNRPSSASQSLVRSASARPTSSSGRPQPAKDQIQSGGGSPTKAAESDP